MTNKITIKTNNQARDVLYAWQLTDKERKEFDYIENIDSPDCSASFVRYKGQVYDLGEFSLIMPGDYKGALHPITLRDTENNFVGWNGYQSDSYFSGLVIKYTDDYCESVIIGRYYS